MRKFDQTILSGIRATGRLHFGNLMGAVQHFVDFQKPENQCLYFIADLHTLTTI
jgi:tryptophanyl-tRNA synthetase